VESAIGVPLRRVFRYEGMAVNRVQARCDILRYYPAILRRVRFFFLFRHTILTLNTALILFALLVLLSAINSFVSYDRSLRVDSSLLSHSAVDALNHDSASASRPPSTANSSCREG
jgi:hypothetical protein